MRATVPKLIDLTEKSCLATCGSARTSQARPQPYYLRGAGRARTVPSSSKGISSARLNNGVTPEEIGELITHLAFYGGWPVAMSGALVAKDVLEQHMK